MDSVWQGQRERERVGGRGNELANRANRAGATEREQLVWNRGFCGLSSSRKHGGEWGEWQGEDTERKWIGGGRQREVDCVLVWGASPPIAIGNAAKFLWLLSACPATWGLRQLLPVPPPPPSRFSLRPAPRRAWGWLRQRQWNAIES